MIMTTIVWTLSVLLLSRLFGKLSGGDPNGACHTSKRTKGKSECYKFETEPYRHELYRPFSPAPMGPDEMNNTFTVFKFHGYGQDITEEIIDVENLGEWKRFHADNPVAVIIHDFLDFPEDGPFGQHWVFRMKDILLHDTIYTVIVVNWKGGSVFPYSQAIANARVVSVELFYLLQELQSIYAVELENYHLIGHGVGAHIAGMTGQRLSGRIGRISGLDPSGRFYDFMDKELRLDIGDALLVDVIHTNAKASAFGTLETCGHFDFYPMGGIIQPGCKEEKAMYTERQKKLNKTTKLNARYMSASIPIELDEGDFPEARADEVDTREMTEGDYRILTSCEHRRAFKYFMESIVTECEFKGEKHDNWKKFELQVIKLNNTYQCDSVDSRCARMGYYVEQYRWLKQKVSSKIYLQISGMPPFCVPYF